MPEQHGLRGLKALIALRVVFVTLLLGSFFFFKIGHDVFPYPNSVLFLIVFMYAATIVYAIALGKVPGTVHAYTQMLVDTLAAIALIYMTGGIESWFSWLLLLVVFLSAMMVNRRAAYTMATVASLFYGLIINWQFYGIIPLPYHSIFEERDFVYKIFSHIFGLYFIAFLSGQLTARLQKSTIDFEDLSRFNRDVIQSIQSGLMTTDLSGHLMLINRSAESILGIHKEQAIGANITEFFPFLKRLGALGRGEGRIINAGQERTIGLSVSELRDASGSHTGYIYTFQDLSELKYLSREIKKKESLAAIGELSAKIAHEIRNPLASLRSSMEMLKESSLKPEQNERLMDIALLETDRLNKIITDFLQFSKPAPITVSEFDLAETLSEILDMLRSSDKAVGITFTRDVQGPVMVKADMDKVKDVFWNVGNNALEAMAGKGELRAKADVFDNNVIITFEDTGQGIGEDDRDRIFFPFYTTKAHGTGLGMSSAYRTMDDHGGSIAIENREDAEGAVVTIELPIGGAIEQ